jgi:phenylalanyl-tRNA synthetase beta chain
LAVVVEESVDSNKVLQLVEKVGGKLLIDLNLFDVYQGEGIEVGFKSLAIALTLQDTSKTLEEKDITDVIDVVVSTLKSELNASLRD